MRSAAWVCFDCRQAVRRSMAHGEDVPCPGCGQRCRPLGDRVPVPPKQERREWQLLHGRLDREQVASAEARDCNDRRFYDALGQERPDVACRSQGCHRGAISRSVFCRPHHFEQIRGRSCPFRH